MALPDITSEAFDRVFRGRPLYDPASVRQRPYGYLSERARELNFRNPNRTR